MEGQKFEKVKTMGEKLEEATKNVVGYFREKFESVLDRIIGDPYFVSPSERKA